MTPWSATAVVTLLMAVAVSTRWWDTPDARIPVVQAGFPLIGVLAVGWAAVVIVLVARTRRTRAWSVPAVALACVPLWLAASSLTDSSVPASASDEVIAASNLEFGRANPEALVAVLARQRVDTLVITEVTPEASTALAEAGLTRLLPHQAGSPRPGADGTMILSRHSVTVVTDEHLPGLFDQPVATVHAPTGDYVLRAMHPYPPTSRLVRSWHRQLDEARQWVDAQPSDTPLVLAGDFNASRAHPAFRRLSGGFDDAHRTTGGGWVRTWPQGGRLPAFVQLDHVIVRGGGVVYAGTATLPGTDHSLVWARLDLD